VDWETCFKIVATGCVAFLPNKNIVFWRAFFEQENKMCFFCQKVWFELALFIHTYIYNIYLHTHTHICIYVCVCVCVYIYICCISYGNSFSHPWYLLVLNKISMLVISVQYGSMKAQVMLMKFSLGICTSFHTYLPFCPHVCIVWRDARLTCNRIWFIMYFNIWKEIHLKMDMFYWRWCGIHEYSVSLKHP